jgi:hypothetical protein
LNFIRIKPDFSKSRLEITNHIWYPFDEIAKCAQDAGSVADTLVQQMIHGVATST